MLFNSFSLVILAIIALSLYYLPCFKKQQIFVLILASFVFYAFDEPRLLLVLLCSAAINIITSYFAYYKNSKFCSFYAAAGVIANLVTLVHYKYWSIMPLGLSFIIFQEISLLIDTFRANKNYYYKDLIARNSYSHIMNTLLFIAFFPKLIAGPIEKAHDFFPQIKTKYFKDIDWEYSSKFLILGYFLKMVIADNLKDYTFWIKFPYFQSFSSVNLLFLTIGYSMQIFADFAGYSLIAIGLASLFGYKLTNNFNFPYISKSFSEFWTRWHISLSSFLKEYLYIPLGGNKKGTLRTYLNIMIVMFLGGLWHGATWNFALWGLCHGLFLIIERALKGRINLPNTLLVRVLQTLLIFTCVNFAWLLFNFTDAFHIVKFFEALVNNTNFRIFLGSITYIVLYSLPVIFCHLYYLLSRSSLNRATNLEYVTYGVMLFLIVTNSGSSAKFVYFRF